MTIEYMNFGEDFPLYGRDWGERAAPFLSTGPAPPFSDFRAGFWTKLAPRDYLLGSLDTRLFMWTRVLPDGTALARAVVRDPVDTPLATHMNMVYTGLPTGFIAINESQPLVPLFSLPDSYAHLALRGLVCYKP